MRRYMKDDEVRTADHHILLPQLTFAHSILLEARTDPRR